MGHARRSVALLLMGLASSACYIDTQRHPGPMRELVDPLPPGSLDDYPTGSEEVLIVRHADPVLVRAAGLAGGVPLPFYRKSARVNSGSWLFVEAGGRAEVIWPSGASVVLFDQGTGVVSSPARGEPLFIFQELTRATLRLIEGDRVELLGGAILIGGTGPFVLEHENFSEILRVRNRSKSTARIAFRSALFDLDPGHVIDLPLLTSGGDPLQIDPDFQTVTSGVTEIQVRGEFQMLPADTPNHASVRAIGEHEFRGQGVRVRLDRGEEVTFLPLGEPSAPEFVLPRNPAPAPAPPPGAASGEDQP